MDQNLQKQIKARIDELPEDVQKAIMASDLDKRIQTIGNKHHLHIDQVGKLEDETLLVMLAFTDPSSFARSLENSLQVSTAEAEGIATDVSNEVFMPIRESMKEFLEQRALLETLAGEQGAAPTTPTPLAPATAPKPAPSASTPSPVPTTPIPKPQVPLAPHPHDLMLVEKTVTTPPTPPKNPPTAPTAATPPPPKPDGYKADPYREPPV